MILKNAKLIIGIRQNFSNHLQLLCTDVGKFSFEPDCKNEILRAYFTNRDRKMKLLNEEKIQLICTICTEAYNSNGTEHALLSTKCGHLFGKSYLEKLIREKNKRGNSTVLYAVRIYLIMITILSMMFHLRHYIR
uniref:RING-type domain-containing protein n=1 Tax=Strongyloides venezuelensis TaxID=75913 RepID=A0A0K0EYR1_STRVS